MFDYQLWALGRGPFDIKSLRSSSRSIHRRVAIFSERNRNFRTLLPDIFHLKHPYILKHTSESQASKFRVKRRNFGRAKESKIRKSLWRTGFVRRTFLERIVLDHGIMNASFFWSIFFTVILEYNRFTMLESALTAYLLVSSDKALLIGLLCRGVHDLPVGSERDQGRTVAGGKETMVSFFEQLHATRS